jgi:hypothetical protein
MRNLGIYLEAIVSHSEHPKAIGMNECNMMDETEPRHMKAERLDAQRIFCASHAGACETARERRASATLRDTSHHESAQETRD